MIAICDHNATGNAAAVQVASPPALVVLAGMEISTAEDVHVVGLFPDVAAAIAAAGEVQATLPELREGDPDYGEQALMDAWGEVVGIETRMLAASSSLNVRQAVCLIRDHRGAAIAAHVDRPSFSVLSQLGFFAPDAPFDAVEISAWGWRSGKREAIRAQTSLPAITSSDSHFLAEIGSSCTVFEGLEPTFAELMLAVMRLSGRSIPDA